MLESSLRELQERGFCVLKAKYSRAAIQACREGFWPTLVAYLEAHADAPNRGPYRHYLPMPLEPPCFTPEFFFNAAVLAVVRGALDERVIADQWGCDVPLLGSVQQQLHVDYRRPLFPSVPDLVLPPYLLVVSFGLDNVALADGPVEIAPGTHRLPKEEAFRAVESGLIQLEPVCLTLGDVLIRHPWALHRGTPNLNDTPRALVTIRYVRHWYADDASRAVSAMPQRVWKALTAEQQAVLRFPLAPR